MKNKWVITDQKLFDLPSLRHTVTNELCVFAPQGELWAYNDSTMSVMINSGHKKAIKTLSSICGIVPPRLTEGEQLVFKIPLDRKFELMKIFLVKKDVSKQLYLANG